WAAVLLAALFFTVRHALDRALRPLGQVMAALDRTGRGCFDTRLPVFREPELGRLAKAFNGMADRLVEAVNDNVRLGSERELNERLQVRIEDDRRSIARELHDELAQGITAVRALAGALVQRTVDQPALHVPAQSIIAVTGQIQDGVRTILHRLRPQQGSHGASVDDALGRYLQAWQRHYQDIRLGMQIAGGTEPVSDSVIEAIVRITQEGLTNVVRHAAATRVEISLRRLDAGNGCWLELVLVDNGRGLGTPTSSAGCGLGLAGMRERAVALAGELRFDTSAGGGTRLCVRLPVTKNHPVEQTT
ncbi:MAG TPA: ATP-binding protein, partial [Noviherbaspirillum sp.]|nr:ATP-binding protein [Noviherbaspirillum sp.]